MRIGGTQSILDPEKCAITAAEFCKKLADEKIPCSGILWLRHIQRTLIKTILVSGSAKFPFESKEYTNPASVEYDKNLCPKAAALRAVTLSLFLHPTWEEVHIQRCIEVFKKILSENLK